MIKKIRVTMSSVKEYKLLSEETPCYSANLLVDRKKIGLLTNDGKGGCCDFTPAGKTDTERRVNWQLFDALCKQWAARNDGWSEFTLDLLSAHQDAHDQKGIMFRIPGQAYEDGQWGIVKCKKSERASLKPKIETKYPGVTFFEPVDYLEFDPVEQPKEVTV